MAEKQVAVRLTARIDAYRRAMAEAKKSTDDFVNNSKKVKQLGRDMQNVGRDMTLFVSGPIVAAGAAGLKMSSDFNTAFAQMVGLADVPAGEVEDLKDAVLDLAGQTARAPQELAEALYSAASAGLDSVQAMNAVDVAARAAAAGLGSTHDIVGLVASATASYGAANISAAEAVDVLTATIRAGRADPDELAGTLGRILPIANNLGVSFDEVGGATAYLSNVMGDTNRTVTAMSGLLNKLSSPTKQGRAALVEMGTSVDELHQAIAQDGLLGALELLREHGFVQNRQALNALFDDVEGRQGAIALLSDESGTLASVMGEVANSSGAAQEAIAAIDTDAQALQQAWVDIQVALIQVGDIIAPIAADIAGAISAIVEKFGELPSGAQTAVVAFGAIVAAIGPMVWLGGKVVTNLAAITKALGMMRAAMLGHPLLALATIATTVATAVWFMSDSADSASEQIDSMAQSMRDARDPAKGLAAELMTIVGENDVVRRSIDAAGLTLDDLAAAALEGGDAWARMTTEIRAAAPFGEGKNTLGTINEFLDTFSVNAIAAQEKWESINRVAGVTAEVAPEAAAGMGELVDATAEGADTFDQSAFALERQAEAVEKLFDGLEDTIDDIEEWAEGINESTSKGAQSFYDFGEEVIASAAKFREELQTSTADVGAWQDDLITIASQTSPEFASWLAEMGMAAAPMVDELANNSGTLEGTFLDWVAYSFAMNRDMQAEFDKVGPGMTEKIAAAKAGVSGELRAMQSTVFADAMGIGRNISAGIAGGIWGNVGAITSAAAGAVARAISAAKAAAEIESPSKLFAREVGSPISAGIAEGIADDADKLNDALVRAIESAKKDALSAAEDMVDAVGDEIDALWGGIDDRFSMADMRADIVEAERDLAQARKDKDPEAVARAQDRLREANMRLAKATIENVSADAKSRASWVATARAAGLTGLEIDKLVAKYDQLAIKKAEAARERTAIEAEASAADAARAHYISAIAMGLIDQARLDHVTSLSSSPLAQLGAIKQQLNDLDRFFGLMPRYGQGTNFHPGGLALVGDTGPEIAQLPRGTNVTPLSMLRGGAAGGGSVVNNRFEINVTAGMGADGPYIARTIVDLINRNAANGGAKIASRAVA